MSHQAPAANGEVTILHAEIRRLREIAKRFLDRELRSKIDAAIAEMERRLRQIGDHPDETVDRRG